MLILFVMVEFFSLWRCGLEKCYGIINFSGLRELIKEKKSDIYFPVNLDTRPFGITL
jgi:hypothetical protein